MPYSYANYTGNGSTTQFTIPCAYLAQAHLHVYVATVEKTLGVDFSINAGTNKVVFVTAPANAAVVTVQRITPRSTGERVVDFTSGAGLQEYDLDTAALQNLYISQEISDYEEASLRSALSDGLINALPVRATRAGKILEFDGSGQPSVVRSSGDIAASAAAAAASAASAAAAIITTAASEAAAAASASAAAGSASAASTSASNASTSATNAATSASNASTSASAASSSASSANSAATNSANSATAASTSATNAANSASTASSSSGAASTSASAASVSASAANTSASAAAGSASAAATSAASAAASASTALNARALQFKGGVAGASVPSASSLAGDYYTITSAGTSQGKTWAVGDQAIYNGSSGSWTQITGYFAASDAADLSATAALIESEGLRFDGTAGAVISGGGIPAVGTGDFTAVCNLNISASNATFPRILNQDTVSPNTVFFIERQSTTDSRIGYYHGITYTSPAGTLRDGVAATAAIKRESGVLSYSVNGSSFAVIASGINDSILAMAMVGRQNSDLSQLCGSINGLKFFNYGVTSTEIAALTRRGLVTLPEQRGGSMVALNTSVWVTSSGTGSFTSSDGATITSLTSTSFLQVKSNVIPCVSNKRFLVSGSVASLTGNTLYLFLANAGAIISNTLIVSANGAFSGVLTVTANDLTAASLRIGFNGSTGSCSISVLSIIPLGTLFEQDSGQRNAGYMVRDTSGNGCDLILPASGVSIIDPAKGGTINYTTNTNGNQQLGGSQVIIPTNARITSWVINSTGTPTISLGNVSGGAQFVSALALAATAYNDVTLLTRFCSTGNLWCSSNSTDTLKHTIQWEYIQ